jgi:hypothetical protein
MYCVYNGNNLNTGNYETNSITVNPPSIKLNKYELARRDGVVVTNKQYGERTIKISGRVLANNITEADTRLDTLNTYFNYDNKDLIVEVAGVNRKYNATPNGFSVTKTGYSFAWEATLTSSSFGEAITTTALAFGTYTTPTSYVNTILGSFKAEPTIDMTVNQVEPYWTTKYIDFNNPYRNERLRITRTWNWYDRVVINGADKTVSLYASTKTVIDACDVTTGWTSSHTLSLDATNMKEGVGCLKNVMAGAAVLVSYSRLNATAIDLSSTMGKVIFPIFIPTPTAGAVLSVRFQIGSDATLAANWDQFDVTTQWDGSALTTNAWNYIVIDLASNPTGTGGTVNRAAIKSILIAVCGTSGALQLNGVLLDYISLQKAGVTATTIDYEGTFPEYGLGTSSILVEDELTSRNITVTGTYVKRYL